LVSITPLKFLDRLLEIENSHHEGHGRASEGLSSIVVDHFVT